MCNLSSSSTEMIVVVSAASLSLFSSISKYLTIALFYYKLTKSEKGQEIFTWLKKRTLFTFFYLQ